MYFCCSVRICKRDSPPATWERIQEYPPHLCHSHRFVNAKPGPRCTLRRIPKWTYYQDPLCVPGRELVCWRRNAIYSSYVIHVLTYVSLSFTQWKRPSLQ